MTLITRSIHEPIRPTQPQDLAWGTPQRGLITSWEIGRKLAKENPELAKRCRDGELPVLYWKGGVAKKLKKKQKLGSLFYLAAWQGLRHEDLMIEDSCEISLTCSATGMLVVYTPDINLLTEE